MPRSVNIGTMLPRVPFTVTATTRPAPASCQNVRLRKASEAVIPGRSVVACGEARSPVSRTNRAMTDVATIAVRRPSTR